MSGSKYRDLLDTASLLMAKGLRLQTVISEPLPADLHPMTRLNRSTGQREMVRDRNGQPRPAFVGKNPSFWLADGTPMLASQRDGISEAELKERIEVAERLSKPIGLAVITDKKQVVIDFDRKNYDSQEAFDAEWTGLLDLYPELTQSRIERTPGGGIHIYLIVSDAMASWTTASGGLHCNFTTMPGGSHRGEVLANGRVCVCAPTSNAAGAYELVNPEYGDCLVEIANLGAIGIYPRAGSSSQERDPPGSTGKSKKAASRSAPPRSGSGNGNGAGAAPALEALIGSKAREVLTGGAPYRGGGGEAIDRSAQLTGFVREVYSWTNLLAEHGLAYSGGAEELIAQAIAVLGIEDKSDRVLATIDPVDCRHRDEDAALGRYRKLSGHRAEAASSGNGRSAGGAGGHGSSAAAGAARPSLQQVLEELAETGISGAERGFALERIADEHGRTLRDVTTLYEGLIDERDAALDADESLDQLEQLSSTAELDVRDLMPPLLLKALEAIRRTAEFQHSTLLAVLLASFSAALPLKSSIELDPSEDFHQPLTLWVLLLMPSGELKTPLLNRLLIQPWQAAVDPLVKELFRNQVKEWEVRKKVAEEDGGPPPGPVPRLPQTLVTEDVTLQGMEVHLEIHDQWANRSLCVWLDEAAAALRQMADPARAGKDASLGGWLLSRYDGTGARGAKVDQNRERHYKSCRLAMVAGCQPDVYREITGDADQSGLSARFIVIEQLSVQQHFPTCWSENDVQHAEALRQLLVRCYRALASVQSLQLRLSPEAFALFQSERALMYRRKRASASAAERSLANKAAGRIGRLAALFHLIWLVAAKEEGAIHLGNGQVGVASMQRAIRFNRFLLDQTVGVRLTSAGNSELGALMLRLQRVAWEKRTPLSVGDLRRALSGKRRPEYADVLHALQTLRDRGYGNLERSEYRGQQGWKYTAHKPLLAAG